MTGVLIVGGGLAGQRCAETLRAGGYGGPLRILCAEPHPPYDRPPLSKELLAGEVAPAGLVFRDASWYAEHEIELVLGRPAERLDPAARIVWAAGRPVRYDRLVIATGSRPRTLGIFAGFENVSMLRTVDDALTLREELRPGRRLAIVGAGFIGLEVAATARARGVEVALLDAAPAPLALVLGPALGGWLADLHRSQGVAVHLGTGVARVLGRGRVDGLALDDGTLVACDAVLVAIGAQPSLDWLAGTGLDPGGIAVDHGGRTCIPGVFAAGDVAAPAGYRRAEHWEAAARLGAAVARSILGRPAAPLPASSFWSDQYGTRIQFLGDTTGATRVRIDGATESRDFTAVYERGGRAVAALLVGRPHELFRIRRLLAPSPDQREAA